MDKVQAMKDGHKAARKAFEKGQEEELRALVSQNDVEKAALLAAAEENEDDRDFLECVDVLKHGGEFFVCGMCGGSVCESHEKDMTSCIDCAASFCEGCSEVMDTCAVCALCLQLTCCNLRQMPCGEWEGNGCADYHYKHCRCEQESSDCGCLFRDDD